MSACSPSTSNGGYALIQLYTFPSRLQYIVSSDNIDDPTVPMRVGQICAFLPIRSPAGESAWIGITTLQIFSSHWRGLRSPSIHDDPNAIGKFAYEADVKTPVKSDCTTDREEVKPTGRKVGTVFAKGMGRMCYVRMEKWFTETEIFATRGTWRAIGGGAPRIGESMFMERADGSLAEAEVMGHVYG
ncbi:MAG: hypothetical protein Q9219_006094 [cf. Caloplaca sp. 3 TL-2023]